jgi:hypothetical protein
VVACANNASVIGSVLFRVPAMSPPVGERRRSMNRS